jgi:hypothetical protein
MDVMQSAQRASLLVVAPAAVLVPLLVVLVPRLPVPILVGEMAAGIMPRPERSPLDPRL